MLELALLRPLPPIDQDPRAFFDFFRAFTSAPEPLGFLAERGLDESELFQVFGSWQAKLAADASMRKQILDILRDPPGPAPEVRPGKPQPRARPEARLDATSLGFVVDRPALPFVSPSADAPLPSFPAPLPRPPPSGLGETKLAFRVDRPALPFAKASVPKDEPRPAPLPSPPRSLAETAPPLLIAKPAMPFQRGAAPALFEPPKVAPPPRGLGETKPAFHVYAPRGAPPGAPLAVTAPSFRIDKLVLPFAPGAPQAPPPASPSAPLPPKTGGLAETSLLLGVNLSAVLPFAKPKTPTPKLGVESYATMCAEIWLAPANALAIIARHGLTPEAKQAEDAAWQARFAASPETKAAWERLAIEAGNRIRAGR